MIVFESTHGLLNVDELTGKVVSVEDYGCCEDEGGCYLNKITHVEVGDFIRWRNRVSRPVFDEDDILNVSFWIGNEFQMHSRDRYYEAEECETIS